jgi:hypothetical protein
LNGGVLVRGAEGGVRLIVGRIDGDMTATLA